ncbi:hypothetical protein [Actinoplanes regularis]|uniref:Uncharacterized protein n=1 Tax=Actinoplanes regularis TaxID=52697 RepID=A0A238UUZ2_9ACTN|nr:hypothetical protein [Actinoplanes regularis]GIE84388.1 hypothetical protein Are01nite_08680 [Actinoplanes regularis]SNR25826.1 hypothetical protein SAMN06264365_101192 [Actinoplanes regularis]
MSGAGIDWRPARTVVATWPLGSEPITLPSELTYRGSAVRLGVPETAAPGDRVLTGSDVATLLHQGDTGTAGHYFGLLAAQTPPGAGVPTVVAVPGLFSDDPAAVHALHDLLTTTVRLPVLRIVGVPLAVAAYATLTGARLHSEPGTPLVVCDLDDAGAVVTVLNTIGQQVRPHPTAGVSSPAKAFDRAGRIGGAVMKAVGLIGPVPFDLIVLGDPEPRQLVTEAVTAQHPAPVREIRLQAPASAVAVGAAAIAAAAVTVDDVCPFGVELPVHDITDGYLSSRWQRLADPDTLRTGTPGSPPAGGHGDLEVEVAAGSVLTVRLTADGYRPLDVTTEPNLPAGLYRVAAVLDEAGLALLFTPPGAEPLRVPLDAGKASS